MRYTSKGNHMKTKVRVTPTDALIAECKEAHNWCTPVAAESIKQYSLTITKCNETMSGVYWQGIIYSGATKWFIVENRGDGGSNHYYGLDHGRLRRTDERLARFVADANIAYGDRDDDADRLCNFLDIIATGI